MWRTGVFVLAIATGVIAEGCGLQTEQPSAGVVDAFVFPFVGLLYHETGNNEFRSIGMATLIDKQYVMVPAYVAETSSKPDQKKYVQFGASAIDDVASALNYTVDKIFVHPNYKKASPSENDIALYRLKEPVQLSDKLSPACLPVKDQDYDAEQYNFVSYNTKSGFNGPRQVSLLKRIKKDACLEAYKAKGNELRITEDSAFICAGDEHSDSCTGDAGSPLLWKTPAGWTAVAFSHSGISTCRTGVPSIFLSVQPYVDWIRSVVDA